MSVLDSLMSWVKTPQSGETDISIKVTSTYASRIVSHWGSELGRASLLQLLMKNVESSPRDTWDLSSRQSSCHRHEFMSQARWTSSKRSRKTLALCIENSFGGSFEGSCSRGAGEVGLIFLAPFSSWSYFLHVSFESKLLLEQRQIQTKAVNKRKTETAGS